MGSDLYYVEVRAREGARVVLDVQVVHPDAFQLPEDPSFALMLLREGAKDTDALGLEVSVDDTMDRKWLRRWARGFIRSVEVEIRNEPPSEAEEDHDHPYWESSEGWMAGTYEIEATHVDWVRHLVPGTTYDSRAFEASEDYDACDPIAPADPARERLVTEGDAFLLTPRALVTWPPEFDCPPFVRHAAYSESAYRPIERIRPTFFGRRKLRSWIGEPIRCCEEDGRTWDGALGGVGDWIAILSPGGFRQVETKRVAWVGRLGFRAGARTGRRRRFADVAEARSALMVIRSEREGATLRLTIVSYQRQLTPRIENSSYVMRLLYEPLVEGGSVVGRGPLADVLRREIPAGRFESLPFDVYARLAQGYVMGFELDGPADPVWPDLEHMDEEDAARRFESLGWPEWRLTVRVSDEAWIAHFPAPRFELRDYNLKDPEPWEGEPARYNPLHKHH